MTELRPMVSILKLKRQKVESEIAKTKREINCLRDKQSCLSDEPHTLSLNSDIGMSSIKLRAEDVEDLKNYGKWMGWRTREIQNIEKSINQLERHLETWRAQLKVILIQQRDLASRLQQETVALSALREAREAEQRLDTWVVKSIYML